MPSASAQRAIRVRSAELASQVLTASLEAVGADAAALVNAMAAGGLRLGAARRASACEVLLWRLLLDELHDKAEHLATRAARGVGAAAAAAHAQAAACNEARDAAVPEAAELLQLIDAAAVGPAADRAAAAALMALAGKCVDFADFAAVSDEGLHLAARLLSSAPAMLCASNALRSECYAR